MLLAFLIATGQYDINHKNKVEYLVVISTILFIWTFVFDFKRFKMDIDKIPKTSVQNNTQPIYANQVNMVPSQNYHAGLWNGPRMNSFETVEMQQGSARF